MTEKPNKRVKYNKKDLPKAKILYKTSFSS